MDLRRKLHNLLHPVMGNILMLHRVGELSDLGDEMQKLQVSPFYLEQTLKQYNSEGIEIISIDAVVDRLKNNKREPFVCLTFDDGYIDTYMVAYPILRKYNAPFCVYMTRDFYQGVSQPVWDSEVKMMNKEQMLSISQDPLCTIGCHTCSHPHLSELSYDEQLSEIVDCKKDIEHVIGREVCHIAFPHGDYDKKTLEIVRNIGFHTAVTTSGCPVRSDADLLCLDRVTFVQK